MFVVSTLVLATVADAWLADGLAVFASLHYFEGTLSPADAHEYVERALVRALSYEGEVTVQFGGEAGVLVTARPGDVIVLPAGTGHKRVSSRGSLGVVGAYPEGSHPDTCRASAVGARQAAAAVAGVPLPGCDPLYGADGPLFQYWR